MGASKIITYMKINLVLKYYISIPPHRVVIHPLMFQIIDAHELHVQMIQGHHPIVS